MRGRRWIRRSRPSLRIQVGWNSRRWPSSAVQPPHIGKHQGQDADSLHKDQCDREMQRHRQRSKDRVKSHSIEVSPPAVATTITGPNTGPSGTSISLTCAATGGYLGTSGQFTYKWSTVNVGGATLSFDSAERNVVVVSLPTVTKDSAFVATCEATDAGGNKGSASQSISVTAPATP